MNGEGANSVCLSLNLNSQFLHRCVFNSRPKNWTFVFDPFIQKWCPVLYQGISYFWSLSWISTLPTTPDPPTLAYLSHIYYLDLTFINLIKLWVSARISQCRLQQGYVVDHWQMPIFQFSSLNFFLSVIFTNIIRCCWGALC